MIEFTDVVKTYAQGNKALNGVTMQIEDGEFCFLVGPSGSGKSTIIKLITGELKPTSGTVHVNGYSLERIRKREIPFLRRTVGVVFQDFRLIDNMTVYENVAFAMRVIGAREREIKERVPYVLDLVGLSDKSKRHPNELSGGEQQRLAIARALVNNPSTIIADEPTGNLDPARSLEIMELLQEINNLGTTMLVVTHAQNLVERFGKRVIAIDEGVVVRDDGEEFYEEELPVYQPAMAAFTQNVSAVEEVPTQMEEIPAPAKQPEAPEEPAKEAPADEKVPAAEPAAEETPAEEPEAAGAAPAEAEPAEESDKENSRSAEETEV